MEPGNEVKDDASVDSPTSVLEDEGICEEKIKVKMEDDILLPLDAKSGDSSLISRTVSKEEEMLMRTGEGRGCRTSSISGGPPLEWQPVH